MTVGLIIKEMYCPKCKQTFEEGSRRFCPTDGARLVSETTPESDREGGIFSHLMPRMDIDKHRDEALAEKAVARPHPAPPIPASRGSEAFFEFDDSVVPRERSPEPAT